MTQVLPAWLTHRCFCCSQEELALGGGAHFFQPHPQVSEYPLGSDGAVGLGVEGEEALGWLGD